MDRGAWWAAVHGVAQSWTLLKRLSMNACIGEGNGNPLQCSCLENPRDGGAWWLTSMELHRIGHDWSDSAAAAVARKTTRPFRYDLNQIPYDYTVEVTSRFKGLDLIDRVPEELWTEVCDIVQEAGIKTTPKERNAKSQNGCLRRPYK